MKNLKTLLITTAVALTLNANAHDPSMHAKKPAKLDCSGYSKMIESGAKIDMTDPVMLAMMKKCKSQKPKHENTDGHHDTEKAEMKCGGDMKKAGKKVEEKAEEHDY